MQPWRLRLKSGTRARRGPRPTAPRPTAASTPPRSRSSSSRARSASAPTTSPPRSGLGYTPSPDDAIAKLKPKEYDAAFFLRPTPVEQVRAVAAAGETMPPKSTYFFPKLLTGIVFNPLESHRSPRGQDLHAQGRRRHHLALVRRPGRRRPTPAPRPTARSTRPSRALGVARSLCDKNETRARRRPAPAPARAVRRRRRAGDRARGRRPPRGRRQPGHRGDGRGARGRRSTATWARSSCRPSS